MRILVGITNELENISSSVSITIKKLTVSVTESKLLNKFDLINIVFLSDFICKTMNCKFAILVLLLSLIYQYHL